jgi:cell division protein FtsI/penicillin-binding protein 2
MSPFRFFKKPRKEEISDEEKQRLFKDAYKLGFEVGYKQHSELGWVAENYSEYVKKASEHGLRDQIEKIYIEGKQAGRRERFKRLYGDRDSTAAKAEKRRISLEERFIQLNQPLMLEVTSNIMRIKTLDLPSLLKGFKFFRR